MLVCQIQDLSAQFPKQTIQKIFTFLKLVFSHSRQILCCFILYNRTERTYVYVVKICECLLKCVVYNLFCGLSSKTLLTTMNIFCVDSYGNSFHCGSDPLFELGHKIQMRFVCQNIQINHCPSPTSFSN